MKCRREHSKKEKVLGKKMFRRESGMKSSKRGGPLRFPKINDQDLSRRDRDHSKPLDLGKVA
jgi:hypothetical protein